MATKDINYGQRMTTKFAVSKVTTTIVLILYYIPIVILVLYSFNQSKYINVWEGFSLKWYYSIFQDEALIAAVLVSLKIASISATLSTVIGTLISFVFVKIDKLYFKTLLIALLSIPFVIPEVIIGAALLLLFVVSEKVIGWPQDKNMFTIILAHMIVGVSYVSVIVQTRLIALDKSIEEAALNLGASPVKVFFVITLPMISKSLLAGWLLAFTLSLDDVVLSSFTSGPESTTLPMLIYSRIKIGLSPQVNVLASIMLLMAILVLPLIYIANIKNIEQDCE